MDWSQPCECVEAGWCPRYCEWRGENRRRLCQRRVDYRLLWGRRFDEGALGHCRHSRLRGQCTVCRGAETLGQYGSDEVAAIDAAYEIAGRTFQMHHYAGRLLPYSQYLWAAALPLAQEILTAGLAPGTKAIDLGCGSGLVGLACLAAGLDVTFADVDPGALELAAANASQNGFDAHRLLELDWRTHEPEETWSAAFASDVLDDTDPPDSEVAGLVDWIDRAWDRTGPCWIADPGRQGSRVLRRELARIGLSACIEEAAFSTWSVWIWRIGAQANGDCRAPVNVALPAGTSDVTAAPCRHRGLEHERLAECPSCGPTERMKVFPCALHDECTLQKPLTGIQCCATCPDYDSAVGTVESV